MFGIPIQKQETLLDTNVRSLIKIKFSVIRRLTFVPRDPFSLTVLQVTSINYLLTKKKERKQKKRVQVRARIAEQNNFSNQLKSKLSCRPEIEGRRTPPAVVRAPKTRSLPEIHAKKKIFYYYFPFFSNFFLLFCPSPDFTESHLPHSNNGRPWLPDPY